MWLCCCGGENILVCAHTKRTYTTSSSSGQVTRLDPSDGSEIWVASLGTHGTSGTVKRAVSAKVGPDGTVYVFYDYPKSGAGAFSTDYGGVAALDKDDGSTLWDTDLGTVSTTGSRPTQTSAWQFGHGKSFLALYEPADVVSPTFAIWVAAYRQATTEDFLFEIDPDDGSILQSFAASDITGTTISGTSATYNVVVADDGDLITAAATGIWNKIETDGTFVWDMRSVASYLSLTPSRGELAQSGDDAFWSSHDAAGTASTATAKMLVYKGEPKATNDVTVLEGYDRLSEWVDIGGGDYERPTDDHEIVGAEAGSYNNSGPSFTCMAINPSGGVNVVGKVATTWSIHAGGSEAHRAWIYVNDTLGRTHLHSIALNDTDFPAEIWDCEIGGSSMYICGGAATTSGNEAKMLSKWNTALNSLSWKIDGSTEDVTYTGQRHGECFEVRYRSI